MQDKQTVLVTGGCGYIGSHSCLALIQAGFKVVVLDNLSNSSIQSLERVARLCAVDAIPFHQGDIRDKNLLNHVFQCNEIHSVMHFAGLKSVGESAEKPLIYYDNNVGGTLQLLEVMQHHQVKNMIFSSSATVYGDPHTTPIQEDFPRSAINPYGQSKLMIEHILQDICQADPEWRTALLRYFNPVGAHPSGAIGEDPVGTPNNLLPYIARVATGQYPHLTVFGDDYPTVDGTGVRDYIHVVDLAEGHVRALQALLNKKLEGCLAINLGTGQGYSVLEMVEAFSKASQQDIAYQVAERRPGDVATCFADPARAKTLLGWEATHNLAAMCEDAWRWQQKNPKGYQQ